ncbi:MAG: hypothetical protein K8S98_13615 [Planctomycetes bacterium]|nr:hypothetical protein [Planctomycetota bacterium]
MNSTGFLRFACALACTALISFVSSVHAASLPSLAAQGESVFGRDWLVKAADNVCGLKDANQLSNPAVVDYDAVLAATPELRKLKDDKIDPASPEGIRLTNAGADRVSQACEAVRTATGHCSVWKAIKHRDGRVIPDITDRVKAQF